MVIKNATTSIKKGHCIFCDIPLLIRHVDLNTELLNNILNSLPARETLAGRLNVSKVL